MAADLTHRAAHGVPASEETAEYPRIAEGVRGVHFIERTVASAGSQAKWTALD